MKLLAIVISYFPTEEEFIQNIKSYIKDVDQLLVWENTPKNNVNYDKKNITTINSEKIIFCGTGVNVGIGKALNFAANFGLQNGFTHLLTLDQDSCFRKDMLNHFKQKIVDFLDHKVGIYGTNLLFPEGQTEFGFNEEPIVVKYCITSGSIVPMETFKKNCFFDEDLFIDGVDLDFCFKANQKHGLVTVVFPSIILEHNIGYPQKTFLGFSASAYSAFRTYFVVKNQILLIRKYPEFYNYKEKCSIISNYLIKRIFTIIFYEKEKKQKVLAMLRGLKEGLLE
ncbi:hypothetical protein [Epilithonimonas vandammei]|uniref:Glycosyltransferase family 2 protein n=1 Tax=Epilithonimonas vandammei TaxID=2487072 RepID=A0A3G8ZPV2_9FLAO|nr:hypothetical protein [Epilithonimonas vandammei]AZI56564.1 hypothetical protein EIB75_15415 [Epilithonimonas vandammei]